MCTAISWCAGDHYFGRNLDLERCYGESIIITPRCFPLHFRCTETLNRHHAFLGMAHLADGVPLYYEAINEKGLCIAGLNFPGEAMYHAAQSEQDNLTPFELIPWLLGQCATVHEARPLLARLNLLDQPFSAELPLTPLHWLLADREETVVIESMADGLHLHENPTRILTNSPPFPYHLTHLRHYAALCPNDPENTFAPALDLTPYSRGMGALGLPGDFSSASRFVKAVFVTQNVAPNSCESEAARVNQFFHLLHSVAMPRGAVQVGAKRENEITVYSSCCNTNTGVYYYTTYENSRVTAVSLHRENLDSAALISYPFRNTPDFFTQN